MARRKTPRQIARELQEYRRQYDRLKARLQEVGFICEGSLVERWMQCGKPNCRCHKDPAKRHGPYYQLSWKKKGKTVSKWLSVEHAHLYQEWIANRRSLEAIQKKMRAVSRKAGRHLLRGVQPPQRGGTKRRIRRSFSPKKGT